ncbi:hypothetical protein RND71_032831 [Anisodus tanguticus]|uniref:Remorin C-terminal domain-containing protein n=1 Tax=Anisodus tanguticus TaxID=243964 RepID=A0AAE1UWY6_9SOLA|nr:hypothetical protein RND71_032831 [Anisodus tanguticus]
MKKNSTSLRNSGFYTNPATPDYGDINHVRGFQKGWSSERVPLLNNSSRRRISTTALMPFNSGRTVPSKWDDAERWITSPYGVWKTPNAQHYRRLKSKSGPLGARVFVPNGVSIHYGAGAGGIPGALYAENSMARATSAPDLSDLCRLPRQIVEYDDTKEPDSVSGAVSRRDMATQMSPDGSTQASPQERSSSIPHEVKQSKHHSAKVEIRDVQVDKGAPFSGLSRKSWVRKPKKELPDVSESISPWDVADGAKVSYPILRYKFPHFQGNWYALNVYCSISLKERKPGSLFWENMQKAKAEAEIQKLDMKLEKRRSASMDKIMNKLRHAQVKAQDMRSTTSESQPHQSGRDSQRIIPFREYFKIASFSSCFVCRIT